MISENIKKTIKEMLTQRGYTDIRENKVEEDKEKGEDTITAVKPNKKKVLVFLESIEKFNVNIFNSRVAILNQNDISHGIILYEDITPATKKALQNTTNLKLANNNTASLIIESFKETTLRVNITKHRLVPKHTKVNLEEDKEMKKYIEEHPDFLKRIPSLLRGEPIVKFYNWKRGDLIEVEREEERENGEKEIFISYRIVR